MKRLALILLLLGTTLTGHAQQFFSFEKGIPEGITTPSGKDITVSETYYKEGRRSLQWNFRPHAELDIRMEHPMPANSRTMNDAGIYLWIYNEKVRTDSLHFEFYNTQGEAVRAFDFRLFSKGWRACWIGFSHMENLQETDDIAGVRLIAPNRKGRVFIDRITLPVRKVNARTTPDYQMPENNSLKDRNLWHWCLTWYWEKFPYAIPLQELNGDQFEQLRLMEGRMDEKFSIGKYKKSLIREADKIYGQAGITRSKKGFTGAPLVAPDELQRQKGEITWADLETMLSGFAADVLQNGSKTALEKYRLVWEYAIDQGFAWGSGMGTNHHYGYQVRDIYVTAWLMRKYIYQFRNADDIIRTLCYWSALQETRQACEWGRDELLDSWHTLTEPKYISAMIMKDDRCKYREMLGISHWLSTSLACTPGTIGGIKPDGTTFHHGMFYPGYTTGVLAHVGDFIQITDGTDFEPTLEAKKNLKEAFISMRNYCNDYEWAIGLSGRHPFGGRMGQEDVNSFAYLALAGDLSGKGGKVDEELAGDYLRLNKKDTPEARLLKEYGIQPAPAPEGFFVYNYGAAGIHRRDHWMVTLKGYNTNVCTAEIYVKDNRYGRYQSYGSVQIFGQPSRKESGYDENGWDWNRLPGTTTIHLPLELLDEPASMSMLRSEEEFAGSSSLEERDGVFGIKLMERRRKNFTPDFVARKSVFCFGNRLICLGSGISNSNADYRTETTLFQSTFDAGHKLLVEGKTADSIEYCKAMSASESNPVLLRDGYDNWYRIKEGEVQVQIAEQDSRHERNRKPTHGTFASAWIDHGTAPEDASYEYMILIQPDKEELKALDNDQSYTVLRKDRTAHIVLDHSAGTQAYVVFEDLSLEEDPWFRHIGAETFVMARDEEGELLMSVCDPNLNIQEKTYTTRESSKPIIKEILLEGNWDLASANPKVKIQGQGDTTLLHVSCQHGIPVEFRLVRK